VADWVEEILRSYHPSTGSRVRRKTCVVEYAQPDGSYRPVVSAALAREYFLKSRCLGYTERQFEPRLDTSFDFCDISLGELEAALRHAIGEKRIFHNKVTLITDEAIVLDGTIQFYYENLISTIPAPLFFELYRGPKDHHHHFRWVTKSYVYAAGHVEIARAPRWMLYHEKEGYVYIPQRDVEPEGLIRFSNVGGGNIVAEFSGDPHPLAYACAKYGYFTAPLHGVKSPSPNIKFVGRFAEWNEELLVHNLIERYA
jgi:hypothetical protein